MTTATEIELILDESILDDETTCVHCVTGAEYLGRLRCCRSDAFLCKGHLANVRANFEHRSRVGAVECGYCHHYWGLFADFEEVIEVIPI